MQRLSIFRGFICDVSRDEYIYLDVVSSLYWHMLVETLYTVPPLHADYPLGKILNDLHIV